MDNRTWTAQADMSGVLRGFDPAGAPFTMTPQAFVARLLIDNQPARVVMDSPAPTWLDNVVGYCVRTLGMSVSDHPAKHAVSPLVSLDGRFLSLTIWEHDARVAFADCANLLRGADGDAAQVVRLMDEWGLHGATIGAAAMNDYVESVGGAGKYKRKFPTLEPECAALCRDAFRGGLVYAPTAGEWTGDLRSYDVNSLYPSVLRNVRLPFGDGEPFDGEPAYDPLRPLWVARVKARADVLPDGVPALYGGWGAHDGTSGRLLSTHGVRDMVLTCADWDIMRNHYDSYVAQWCGGYRFKASAAHYVDWVDLWYGRKRGASGVARTVAKLVLNGFVGKTGARPPRGRRMPLVTSDHIEWKPVTADAQPSFTDYPATAAFVTAYARKYLADTIRPNRDHVLYCDTDSMITDAPPVGVTVGDGLGEWKVEREGVALRVLGLRKYAMKLKDGGTHTCLAGVPLEQGAIPYDNFRAGATIFDNTGCAITL